MDSIKAALAAVNEPEVNETETEGLSLAQIKALAEGHAINPAAKTVTKVVEPIEDEIEDEEDDEDEEDEDKFVREIDLGDGSGVQVFKASTQDKLLDKLADAQRNATIKIRQQADQLKKFSVQKAKDDADNEYILGQEQITKPTTAFKKMFKETTGVDIETFKTKWERVEALEAAQNKQSVEDRKNAAATDFIQAHPEYIPNKANGARLEKAVNILIADAERQNRQPDFASIVEAAFKDLSDSGLLALKSDEPAPATVEPTPEPVKTAKKSSGLSSRVRTITTPRSTEPSEDDLYEMPLDKLRTLAIKKANQ